MFFRVEYRMIARQSKHQGVREVQARGNMIFPAFRRLTQKRRFDSAQALAQFLKTHPNIPERRPAPLAEGSLPPGQGNLGAPEISVVIPIF